MLRPIAALTAVLLVLSLSTSAVAGDKWAVVFAPGVYEALDDSPYHLAGTKRLRSRLLGSGFDERRIRLLANGSPEASGPATSAALEKTLTELSRQLQPEDLLLVVVASYGIHDREMGDFVCDVATTKADIAALAGGTPPLSLVSVNKLIGWMIRAPKSVDQCLIIDGTATDAGFEDRLVTPFGRSSRTQRDRQFVFFGRTGELKSIRKPPETRTIFMQSILDGLSGHADFNDDGEISVLELAEYSRYFAAADRVTLPRLSGNSSRDFVLGTFDPKLKNADLSIELRIRLAETLLNSARTALLLERDIEGARNATRRALEYGITGPLHDEITMMMLTSKVLDGHFAEAWKDSQSLKQPLLIFAQKDIDIEVNGATVGQFDAGKMGLITHTAPGFAWLKTTYSPVWKNGRLTFTESATNGWVRTASLSGPAPENSTGDLVKALTPSIVGD